MCQLVKIPPIKMSNFGTGIFYKIDLVVGQG